MKWEQFFFESITSLRYFFITELLKNKLMLYDLKIFDRRLLLNA